MGVYGQVQLGSDAVPPPLVYPQPLLIVREETALAPIYLHVPPGHARHWREHCFAYAACNRPVYFIRSEEYDPGYEWRYHGDDNQDENEHDHGHRNHGRGHGHGHDEDD